MSQVKDNSPLNLNLASHDVLAERIEKLKVLMPEVFVEGKIDFDQLKRFLGEWVEPGKERFGLQWPGKADCIKIIQQTSVATLKPCREESVNFDETENVFIEGENLEVLKLLQKAYFGKIKMIYIDPPYNTGKEFIYPDKYSETLESYLAYTGQVDDEGRKSSTDKDAQGRFHTRWLNMMYPRLLLARNLLREDGVIFISIDDNEFSNLEKLCNEIFGEENHLTTLHIKVRYEGKTLVEDMDFQKLVEQVLVYAKSKAQVKLNKPRSSYSFDKFRYKIIEKGVPKTINLGGKKVEIFSSSQFEIIDAGPSKENLKEIWASGKILDGNSSGRFFRDYLSGRSETDGLGVLYKVHEIGNDNLSYRYFTGPKRESATKGRYYQGVPSDVLIEERTERAMPITTFYDFADNFGNCRHEGNIDFRDGKKPVEFLKTLINLIHHDSDEILLDFFAGSGSFAHAVLDFAQEHDLRLKTISIQLPEPLKEEGESSKIGFKTIADIGKERFRRVIGKLANSLDGQLRFSKNKFDLGFKVFKLDRSNFKIWEHHSEKADNFVEQLSLYVDHIDPQSTPEALLYELLLKSGFPLTATVNQITLAGKQVFSIDSDKMLLCFEDPIKEETLLEMLNHQPAIMVALDKAFHGNDQLKTNIKLQAEAIGESEHGRVLFKTV